MDHSAMPEAARDLVAAAELEAESILESHREDAKELADEAYRSGVDPTGIGFSPGSTGLDLAREALAEGRNEAAVYLFKAVARIYWDHVKPDIAVFTARLDEIWDDAFRRFQPEAGLGKTLKRDWRAWALRARSSPASDAEATREETASVTPVCLDSATGGNRTRDPDTRVSEDVKNEATVTEQRSALLNAYRAECRAHGIRVTDKMIAVAARPTWHDRTPVQRWKRNDPRCTLGDDAAIRAVLKKKPHLSDANKPPLK